jgi:hypothetical protein
MIPVATVVATHVTYPPRKNGSDLYYKMSVFAGVTDIFRPQAVRNSPVRPVNDL